jgi:hypothetical protein
MTNGQPITLRLTIIDPVPGVTYSLQDKTGKPVEPRLATHAPLSFDVPVRRAGARFLGPLVRSEGPARRFVYIAIGAQAGDTASGFGRRAKIDIHDIPSALLDRALGGAVLEARLPGRDKNGDPACATVRPLEGWRLA